MKNWKTPLCCLLLLSLATYRYGVRASTIYKIQIVTPQPDIRYKPKFFRGKDVSIPSDFEAIACDSRNRVKSIASSQIGIKEGTGNNDGDEVEKYLQHVGLQKGYAWCAAFVCWVYSQAGIENPKSAWCPTLFRKKNIIYQRNKRDLQANPRHADTFGIWFNSLKRVAHVGLIDEWPRGSHFISVEGNTNNEQSRDGDGVYRKRRLKTQVYQVSDYISQK